MLALLAEFDFGFELVDFLGEAVRQRPVEARLPESVAGFHAEYRCISFRFRSSVSGMPGDHTRRVYESILELLPTEDNPTPLVRLIRVVPHTHARIYAKLEWYNPFGAVKDRVAANLVRDAEERGVLGPGKQLVEATSGNTGLGLAMIGNQKGYPLETPLSAAIPLEKRTVLRFFGAEVVELDDSLCPAPGAPEGAIARARETAATRPGTILLDQYTNEANPGAHFRTTGPEIWRQTGGAVTHFVAGLGTCGTITGTGRFLKQQNPAVKVLGVYPEDGHDIPGVRSKRQLAQTSLYFPQEYRRRDRVVRSRVLRSLPAAQSRREHHCRSEFRNGPCGCHSPGAR